MRKYILLLLAISVTGLLLISSCEKDETIYQDYIIAGSITDGLIYHDYIPDDTLYSSQYKSDMSDVEREIDINNDGVYDFRFISNYSESPAHSKSLNRIITLNNSAIIIAPNEAEIIDTLLTDTRIDANSNWKSGDCLLSFTYFEDYQNDTTNGLWRKVKDSFVGVRVVADDNIFYGWISVEMTNYNITIIKAYACTNGVHE